MPKIETTLTPPSDTLLDAYEILAANGERIVCRSGMLANGGTTGLGAATPDLGFHTVNVGTVAIAIFENVGCYEMVSAAATVNGRQGGNLRGFPPFGANRANDPLSSRRPVEYIVEALMIRASPLTANTAFGCGFRRFNGVFGLDTTGIGISLDSITTINGGNWTVFRRLVTAGAMLTVDTGVAGDTRAFVRFRYEDQINPRLRVELNGTTVLDVSGVANIPRPADATAEILDWGFFQGDGTMAGAGQVDRIRQVRVRAAALAGYPL